MSSPFDSAKYKALLEGLEITIMRYSMISLGDRADAEYYSKCNLQVEKALLEHNAVSLGTLGEIVASAFYPAAVDLYEEGDVLFARCVDCVGYPVISEIQDDSFVRIPSWFVEKTGQIRKVSRGDVIVTKVGTPCYASFVHDYDEIALSRTVLGINNLRGINGYYLVAFLRSKFGFSQLLRERELTIQYQLTLERMKTILVYQPSDLFQKLIEKTMINHIDMLKMSMMQQKAAEETLIQNLGLADWQPPTPLTYTRSASEAFEAGRLDAEFFSTGQVELEELLVRKYPLKKIGEIGKVTKGRSVSYSDEGEVPIIRSGDLYDLTDNTKFLLAHAEEDISYLEIGDILISSIGFGSIGKIQVFDKQGDYGTVSEVTICRQKVVNPYFLAVYLRSVAGQYQINRWITGATGQLHLYPKDVERIVVPRVEDKVEDIIETLWKDSERGKIQARSLLDRAKRAVEIAIEQSEQAAMRYLEEAGD